MPVRIHDGLNLAVSLGLLLLGSVMVYFTTGGRDPGNLFFPRPAEPVWLAALMGWQETAAFGAVVALVGAALLWYELGLRVPAGVRVVLLWTVLTLLWDLLLYRAVGFWTARNPPWWATVWLLGLTVAFSVRRVGDLYSAWRGGLRA